MPVTLPGIPTRPPNSPPGSKKLRKKSKPIKSTHQKGKVEIIPTPRVTCLILSPFDAPGMRIKDTIENAMNEIGIVVLSLDNLRPGAAWVNAVTDAIKFSDFVIVDISRQNPNVMYELGYAHALRKPTIFLMSVDAKSPPPSDLEGILYITYNPENLRSLKDDVMRSASRYKISGGTK